MFRGRRPTTGTVVGIRPCFSDKGIVVAGTCQGALVTARSSFSRQGVTFFTVSCRQPVPGYVTRNTVNGTNQHRVIRLAGIQAVKTDERRGIVNANPGLGIDDFTGDQLACRVVQLDSVAKEGVNPCAVDNLQMQGRTWCDRIGIPLQ